MEDTKDKYIEINWLSEVDVEKVQQRDREEEEISISDRHREGWALEGDFTLGKGETSKELECLTEREPLKSA